MTYRHGKAQERLRELAGDEEDSEFLPGAQPQPGPVATESAVLNALPAHVAVIDREGVILSVNERWQRFAAGNALDPLFAGPGQNYVELCERALEKGDAGAHAAATGIGAIPERRLDERIPARVSLSLTG